MKKNQMNALVFEQAGQAKDVLDFTIVGRPTLSDGQVIVKVQASPINPSDFFFINGTYRFKPEFPQTAGMEATGVIQEVPEGSRLKAGMRVPFFSKSTWAEYVAVDTDKLLVIPTDLPIEKASLIGLNAMTAWGLFETSGAGEGDWLLLTAGNSNVAKLIMQMARYNKVNIIAAVRKPEHHTELAQYTDHVLDIASSGLNDEISRITLGKGITALIDPVGGPVATAIAKSLCTDGKIVFYGALSDQPVQFDNADFVYRNISARGFGILSYYQTKSQEELIEITSELIKILTAPKFIENITKKYSLRDFKSAIAEAGNLSNGKVMFVVEET